MKVFLENFLKFAITLGVRNSAGVGVWEIAEGLQASWLLGVGVQHVVVVTFSGGYGMSSAWWGWRFRLGGSVSSDSLKRRSNAH